MSINYDREIYAFLKEMERQSDSLVSPEINLVTHKEDIFSSLKSGKKIRPYFMMLFAKLIDINLNKIYPVAIGLEIYHNSTLILDDIQDDSKLRRNKECLHILRGTPLGIATAALLRSNMYYPIQKTDFLNTHEKYAMMEILNDTAIELCIGQYVELSWIADNRFDVNENDYFNMVEKKTGALFAAAIKIPFILAGYSEDSFFIAEKLGKTIGSIFQIKDDLLSVTPNNDQFDKDLYADIHESKRTLLVIHTIQDDPIHAEELIAILNKKSKSQEDYLRYLEILQANNSFDYVNDHIRKQTDIAKQLFDQLNDEKSNNQTVKETILQLILFLSTRSK